MFIAENADPFRTVVGLKRGIGDAPHPTIPLRIPEAQRLEDERVSKIYRFITSNSSSDESLRQAVRSHGVSQVNEALKSYWNDAINPEAQELKRILLQCLIEDNLPSSEHLQLHWVTSNLKTIQDAFLLPENVNESLERASRISQNRLLLDTQALTGLVIRPTVRHAHYNILSRLLLEGQEKSIQRILDYRLYQYTNHVFIDDVLRYRTVRKGLGSRRDFQLHPYLKEIHAHHITQLFFEEGGSETGRHKRLKLNLISGLCAGLPVELYSRGTKFSQSLDVYRG